MMAENSFKHSRTRWTYALLTIAMLAAAALAFVLKPDYVRGDATVDLETLIPEKFGQWQHVHTGYVHMDLAPRRDDEAETNRDSPYDRTLMRTYSGPNGAIVMLAVAYGARQRQEVKIHRPELCYIAQGFNVSNRSSEALMLDSGHAVTATRILAQNDRRTEPVTYWIRIGDEITLNAWQSRVAILREGLRGRIPDGILVRASQAFPYGQADIMASYNVQAAFLRDLFTSLDAQAQQVVAGRVRVGEAG